MQVPGRELRVGDRIRMYHHARCDCCDPCPCGRQIHRVSVVSVRNRTSRDGGLSVPDPLQVVEVVYDCGNMMGFYHPDRSVTVMR